MADSKLSALGLVITLDAANRLYIEQGGVSVAITWEQLKTLLYSLDRDLDFNNNDVLNLQSLGFQSGGTLTWNTDFLTTDIDTGVGVTIQSGQSTNIIIYNNTGSIIQGATMLRHNGAVLVGAEMIPTVELAQADTFETSEGTLMLSSMDISIGGVGIATYFGRVSNVDTSALSVGDIYLSPTVAGGLTNTKPDFPDYDISVGGVVISNALTGLIFFSVNGTVDDTFDNFFNGTFREPFDFTVASDGTTTIGSLSPSNGHPNMTMQFSDGFTTLIATPAVTISLTAGTDTNPQRNYIYIPQSTKVLTISTSGYPTTVEHIKVAYVLLRSHTATQTDDAFVNRNVNDPIQDTTTLQGHLSRITQRLRLEPAKWTSGAFGTITIDNAPTPDDVNFANTSGTVSQLNSQTFPALNTAGGDTIHVVNDSIAPYRETTNLNTELLDSTGASLNNTSFSFVIWGVVNKTGENPHLMLNLPTGTYSFTASTDAVNDADNHSVYSIPDDFTGVGFLIGRYTFTYKTDDWVLIDSEDLRGKIPNTTAGGGGGGAGVTEWTALTDTPSSYIGEVSKFPRVNVGETGLEFGELTNTDISTVINAATSKTTPIDADTIPIIDSAAVNVLKKFTWANLKATLKTYFDTIYGTVAAVALNTAKVTNASHTSEVTGDEALTIDKTSITGKTTVVPVAGDFINFSDTSDSGIIKKADASLFLGAGGSTSPNHNKGIYPLQMGAELVLRYQWYGNSEIWGFFEDGGLNSEVIATPPVGIVPPLSDITTSTNSYLTGWNILEDGTITGFEIQFVPRHLTTTYHIGFELRRHTYVGGVSTGFVRSSLWYDATGYVSGGAALQMKEIITGLSLSVLAGDQVFPYIMCSSRTGSSAWSVVISPTIT